MLSLLRFASQVLARAVVFAVEGDQAHCVGEFGLQARGAAEAIREARLPLREPSILMITRWAADYYHHPVGDALAYTLVDVVLHRASHLFAALRDDGRVGDPERLQLELDVLVDHRLAVFAGRFSPASREREAVAVPPLVAGEVRYVLYGDNAPLGRPLGPLDALESAAARAARIVEKTLAARVAKPRGAGI